MHDPAFIKALLERALKSSTTEELGKRLNSPPHLITIWRDGMATMPERKVFALMQLLNEMGT